MSVTVLHETLADLSSYLTQAPDIAKRSMRIAINDTLRGPGLKAIRDRMAREVAFPAGYLTDPRKLAVSRFATETNLEGAIRGRQTPTSLARFSSGGGGIGQRGGVNVRVGSDSGPRTLKRAFIMRLPQGRVLDEDSFNLALAIRLKPGEKIQNKRVMIAKAFGGADEARKKSTLYLLYGPSVDQVFRSVAYDVEPDLVGAVQGEFYRQFVRLSEGK